MQKPSWYEDEIARLKHLYRYDRVQAEEHIERDIVEYRDQFEEYEEFEEIAWEYYDYVPVFHRKRSLGAKDGRSG